MCGGIVQSREGVILKTKLVNLVYSGHSWEQTNSDCQEDVLAC